jgi:GTP cyclohydrolase IA
VCRGSADGTRSVPATSAAAYNELNDPPEGPTTLNPRTRANGPPASAAPAGAVDQDRIRRAVREILAAVGEDPDREGLVETPDRVARMYAEIFCGLHADPAEHLKKTFTQKHDELVLVKDIEFASCCEHHLLPFTGKAHIAYLPAGKVVGLSKLARVVDVVARRPQVQERMTEELADLICRELNPRGVGVIVEASHSCMTIRGVRKPGSMTITSALRGIVKSNPTTRAELMSLVFGHGR